MPLPNVASGRTAQCTARSKRNKRRCLNPAAFGMPVCRFHGARRFASVKRGSDHPQYSHGRETVEARRRRVEAMSRIRDLVELGVHGGFIERRIPGRRPTQNPWQSTPTDGCPLSSIVTKRRSNQHNEPQLEQEHQSALQKKDECELP